MYHSFMLFVYNLFMAIFFVNQKEDPYPSCMAPSSRDPSIKVKSLYDHLARTFFCKSATTAAGVVKNL